MLYCVYACPKACEVQAKEAKKRTGYVFEHE